MNNFKLKGITKSFGENQILKGFDLECKQGEKIMLVGPNGVGKSTLLRILLGLIKPDAGQFLSDEKKVCINNVYKQKIGYLPENIAFCETLSGQEVLSFFVSARGLPKSKVIDALKWAGLSDAGKKRTGCYSKGMRQRLGLAIAVLDKPNLLILDEPTSGLDQEGLSLLWQVLDNSNAEGQMVLMTSHNLGLLERRIDKMCIMKNGRQVFFGTPLELRNNLADNARIHICFKNNHGCDKVRVCLDQVGLAYELQGQLALKLSLSDEETHKVWGFIAKFQDIIERVRTEEPVLEEIYERLIEDDT